MSDIVERLKELASPEYAGLLDVERETAAEAAAEITHLRTFITALEDGNMTFLCDELDKAKAENTRLRSLLEEAGKVVERCQAVLAIMVKPDMTVSSLSAYTACVEAELAARTFRDKMKEG